MPACWAICFNRTTRAGWIGASISRLQAVAGKASTTRQDLVLRCVEAGVRVGLGAHRERFYVDAYKRPVFYEVGSGHRADGREVTTKRGRICPEPLFILLIEFGY